MSSSDAMEQAMVQGRNILDEHAKKTANKRPKSPPPPKQAAQPLFPPPLNAEDWDTLVAWVNEACMAREDGIIIISVDDELIDRVLEEADDAQVRALHLLPGTYFNTGAVHNDYPVWKSRMPPSGSADPMLLFVFEGGWYASSVMFQSCKLRDQLSSHIVGFAKVAQGATSPVRFHFPFWCAKPSPHICVESALEWALRKSETTAEEHATATDELMGKLLMLEREKEEMELNAAQLLPAQQEVMDVQLDADESAQLESSEVKGKGKGRSGWIPKITPLLAAVYKKDWTRVREVCDELYGQSAMLKKLVDQKLERRR